MRERVAKLSRGRIFVASVHARGIPFVLPQRGRKKKKKRISRKSRKDLSKEEEDEEMEDRNKR
jgi:hypothetical protein